MSETRARGLPRLIEGHLGSRDIARVIYGTIIGLAVVVALEVHPPGAGAVAATLAGTALAVGLAEMYSEAVASGARTHRRLERGEMRALAAEAGAVAFGAGFPAVFFVAAMLDLMEVDTAFEVAEWTGLGLICAYGYFGARLSGSGRWLALAEALAVGVIGGFLIALKALVH
jgi:hypothetical protein